MMWWLNRTGNPEGPYEEPHLLHMIQSGQVRGGYIGQHGGNAWMPIEQHPAFAAALRAVVPVQGNGSPSPTTVFGVPVEPGERVIYYKRKSWLGARIALVIFGIPLIPVFGIGLYLFYWAITHRKSMCYAQVITNQRLLTINGHGQPLFAIRWQEVRGLYQRTTNGRLTSFGVRRGDGHNLPFSDDVHNLQRLIPYYLQTPMAREQAPAVQFDTAVV